MERDLTHGNVFKTLISFSLPFLLSYFLQTLYGMADLFIIGQFNGTDCTTAVSIGSQVMHMVTVVIVGLAMGATVMIGRAIGAKKHEETGIIIGNTVILFMTLAVCLAVLLLLLVRQVTVVMSTPEAAVEETISYLAICFLGIPFITAYNIISSIFRGIGDSKSPMYFALIACVANIGLDYLFIGALEMGAAGAALGTTIAQAISVIVSFIIVAKRKTGISISTAGFRPKRAVLGSLLKIGIPVAVQDGFIQVAFLVITIIANQRGLSDAAAVGVVEKIIGVLFLIPSTMLSSVSALSAQNIGARKHDRVEQTLGYAIIITVVFGTAVSVLMQFQAETFVGLFTKDENVVHMGGQYMRSYVWDCIFAGIHFCFSGYFCAYGKSVISFLHNFLSIILVRIPVAYFASAAFTDTLFPMGIASPAGSALSVLICLGAYFWLHRKHTELFTL